MAARYYFVPCVFLVGPYSSSIQEVEAIRLLVTLLAKR